MKRFITLFFALLAVAFAMAQTVVTGTVADAATGEQLPFVNIRVSRSGAPAKVVKTVATDEQGAFSIERLSAGSYDVTFTFVGYKTASRSVSLSKGQPALNLGTVALETSTSQLGEATVTAERSTMRLEVDRKSYNIGADLSNVGASASDALENIPSVEVDQDGNISMRGSSSVEVWINGKPSGLNADNRAMILQQMPAETIDRIEVIDNPSAKYSAEGSAGIINIVLKQDRRAGYFGSVQVGGNTALGANASGNINYNSKWVDFNATLGYRHREDKNGSVINQQYIDALGNPTSYQRSETDGRNRGNNIFARGGITLHASKKDDITLSGNMMQGWGKDWSDTPYYYGNIVSGTEVPTQTLWRRSDSDRPMRMLNADLDYRHSFSEKHYIALHLSRGQWKSDFTNIYRDSTVTVGSDAVPYNYQRTEQNINNRWTAVKLDYENTINEHWQVQAGYNADLHREKTPQQLFADNTSYNGTQASEDEKFFNRFTYDYDVHALYATTTMKYGKWGAMVGLRGEYWTTSTLSKDYEQEHGAKPVGQPDKRRFFQLFPSVFLSYQITPNDQLQINYSRRLRRPWGGELNPFMDTRSATNLNFGNPDLTPEFSNAFSLNYLRTWREGAHSMLVSAFYRPTDDVMQRLNYRMPDDFVDADGQPIETRLLSTSKNVTKSTSTGGEVTVKNRFATWMDLNTTVSAYYYHLDAFDYEIIDPLYHQPVPVSGRNENRFTWSARLQANVRLPQDWSIQATGRYRSREAVSQGWRDPSYGLDMGIRKSFLKKTLMLALNCRDVLNSHRFEQDSATPTFTQHAEFRRHSRKVNLTLTWNFGNIQRKWRPDQMKGQPTDMNGGADDGFGGGSGYGADMGE